MKKFLLAWIVAYIELFGSFEKEIIGDWDWHIQEQIPIDTNLSIFWVMRGETRYQVNQSATYRVDVSLYFEEHARRIEVARYVVGGKESWMIADDELFSRIEEHNVTITKSIELARKEFPTMEEVLEAIDATFCDVNGSLGLESISKIVSLDSKKMVLYSDGEEFVSRRKPF